MTLRQLKASLLAGIETLGINRAFRRLNRGRIKVLMLHSVSDTGPFRNAIAVAEFRALLRHIKDDYNIVTLSADGQWVGLRDDQVNLLLTFDDGFIDNYSTAFPMLKAEGLFATFFLIADCVPDGSAPSFAAKYGIEYSTFLTTVDKVQARELVDSGMTVGSHSACHSDFLQLSDDEVCADASRSQRTLMDITGGPVGLFAFPKGFHRPDQIPLLLRYYRRIFTTEHGFNSESDTVLRRNEVVSCLHGLAAASGALDALKRLSPRYLLALTH